MEPKLLHFDIPDPAQPSGIKRLVCYQWGDPNAPKTVLCVHGLTRNGRDFDALAQELANEYRVLCPDMPGRGRSQWLKNPQGYNNVTYVSDLLFILRALHIPAVHWIGTSMGGILGMMAANHTQANVVRSMVLNDIGSFIPAEGLQRIRDIADLKTSYPNRADAQDAYRKRCESFGVTSEEQWQHYFTYGLHQRSSGITDFTYDPAIFTVGFPKEAEVNDVDLWPLWPAVSAIPVLLIRGAMSDILTRRTAIEMESRHRDLLLYEVDHAGHAPTLMDEKEVALIHEWINAREETP